MKAALIETQSNPPEGQIVMLNGHFSDGLASTQKVGESDGYSNRSVGNSQFRNFCHFVADEPRVQKDDSDWSDWIDAIAHVVDPNDEGHAHWRLKSVAARR